MYKPYASTFGSLMYATVATQPDIVHTVEVVGKFKANLVELIGMQSNLAGDIRKEQKANACVMEWIQ